jgi:Cdc6-like AAA superfamily ATPase
MQPGCNNPESMGNRTPFVGREIELDALMTALEAARHGHGSLVLIAGESGIGKTRHAFSIRQHGR